MTSARSLELRAIQPHPVAITEVADLPESLRRKKRRHGVKRAPIHTPKRSDINRAHRRRGGLARPKRLGTGASSLTTTTVEFKADGPRSRRRVYVPLTEPVRRPGDWAALCSASLSDLAPA